MDVGAALREARQRAGLSREALSQRTKIQLAKIEALEENAFERLPDGIYLDGLIRAYANEVGLDGSDLVMRLRRDDEVGESADFADYEYADFIPPPATMPLPTNATAEPPLAAPTLLGSPPPTPTSRASRSGVALLLVLLASVGLGAFLYDRMRTAPPEVPVEPAVSHERDSDSAVGTDATAATREVTPIPDEAVPADRPSAVEHHADPPDGPSAPNAPSASAAPNAPGAPGAPSASAPDGATVGRPSAPSAPPRDLGGKWTLSTRVDASSLAAYEGLELGYELHLQQAGTRISGEGVKTAENGRPLGRSAQTPIVISGALDGTRLTLSFTERGTQRASAGRMILDLHEDGVMRGRFSSDAARSSGHVEARRR
jgi:cytoskeleton protein RodZ